MSAPFRGSTGPYTRGQLRTSRFRQLSKDVFVLASAEPGVVLSARALQVAVPDGVLSHATAAELLRLPVPRRLLGQLHVTRPPGSAVVRRPGVTAHVRALGPEEVVDLRVVRVTSPARVFLDLAPALGPVDLVSLGDAVARRTTLPELQAAVAAAGRRRGVVAARAALRLTDPGAASPAETRARLLLHGAGFAALRHGVVIRDEHGQWLAEPDLADPQAQVAVQYDGGVHFTDDERQRQRDVDRDELSRLVGWEVVVLTSRDLRRPHVAVARTAAAYERAADRRLGATLRTSGLG